MQIIHTVNELKKWRKSVGRTAFVPTMGNLHEGHLALVREAAKHTDNIAVSIFVNPLQFGQGEDFNQYPRTLQQDADKLNNMGVAVVFAPDIQELYPHTTQNYNIEPPYLQHELCGKFRPGHFRGVATVVTKLFNIVKPDIACFGKKDYQQLIIVKGLVADLNMDIEILPVDTGRATDGLALSSRNQYLSPQARVQAPRLYQELCTLAHAVRCSNSAYTELTQAASTRLEQAGWTVDYIEVRKPDNLMPADKNDKHLIILAAARLESVRLIDNIEIHLS